MIWGACEPIHSRTDLQLSPRSISIAHEQTQQGLPLLYQVTLEGAAQKLPSWLLCVHLLLRFLKRVLSLILQNPPNKHEQCAYNYFHVSLTITTSNKDRKRSIRLDSSRCGFHGQRNHTRMAVVGIREKNDARRTLGTFFNQIRHAS